MNLRHIHTAAHLSGSIYRIAYMSMLLISLLKRRNNERVVTPPNQRFH